MIGSALSKQGLIAFRTINGLLPLLVWTSWIIGCHRVQADSYLYKICAEGSNALANELEEYFVMISTTARRVDLAGIVWSFNSLFAILLTKHMLGMSGMCSAARACGPKRQGGGREAG